MTLPPPTALCLDLDDTLLDGSALGTSLAATCHFVADQRGLEPEEVQEANNRVWSELWPELSVGWTTGSVSGAELTAEAWARTVARCGAADVELASRAVAFFDERQRSTYRLFADATRFLERASQAGLPLALITNGASDTQREKLAITGLPAFLDVVVITGELGVAKPDTGPFRRAITELRADPSTTWHVGDNLHTDVGGALEAGLPAVWVNRHARQPRPDDPTPTLEVATLDPLIELLAP